MTKILDLMIPDALPNLETHFQHPVVKPLFRQSHFQARCILSAIRKRIALVQPSTVIQSVAKSLEELVAVIWERSGEPVETQGVED